MKHSILEVARLTILMLQILNVTGQVFDVPSFNVMKIY
jgi:hypothetical protein